MTPASTTTIRARGGERVVCVYDLSGVHGEPTFVYGDLATGELARRPGEARRTLYATHDAAHAAGVLRAREALGAAP